MSVALRLPWVQRVSAEQRSALRVEQRHARLLIEELLGALDRPWMEDWRGMHARINDLRIRETMIGDSWDKPEPTPEPWGAMPDPLTWNCLFGRDNFWAAIDTRDCARSVELAMDADTEGSHALFVNDSRNWPGVESEKLLRVFFPEVTERRRQLSGAESLVSAEAGPPQHRLHAPAPPSRGGRHRR